MDRDHYQDGTISISAHHHDFVDSAGLGYHIYYAGFNLTSNWAGDDMAYVKITHDGVNYDNLHAITNPKYTRIDYILSNDAGWRKWLAGGGSTQGWTHSHVEIKEIKVGERRMVWTVHEGDQFDTYEFYRSD